MAVPSIFGGSCAAQFNAARSANNVSSQPQFGAGDANFSSALSAQATGGTAAANQQQQAQIALNAFQKKLLPLLSAAKVDTSQEIHLESDGQGGIRVAGNSPDADKITAVLSEHPELAVQFESLQQQFQKLRAADPASVQDDKLHPPVFGITLTDQQAAPVFE